MVTIHVAWSRLLPRSSTAVGSYWDGASLLITRVKKSPARTPEKIGHAAIERTLMTVLSSDARLDARPGGIGARPRPISPPTARMTHVPMSTRMAVALFFIGQPTCNSPAM